MTVGPIWNTGGTETEIIVPVSVLGPERAGTEMGGNPGHPDRDAMFVNIYAGELAIRKTCNSDKSLNHILKVMDGCMALSFMHIFCLVSIKTHIGLALGPN